ncbi:hypothetical protein [Caenibacillus caldisaponilyticus]|uniref:hypothetical protein n=1 Tax=Caenibacillus caldisaponilyticus TaxID=1674942 RepID=UPI00098851EF|nr:hypothetical protein [Caenibacillus caldisaponilyticus]
MADKKEDPRVCVRCGHVGGENDSHCIKCGAPLINKCADEPGLISDGCTHVNRPDAAFCAKCGHPTVFHKEGLVPPFQPFHHSIMIQR